MRSVIPIKSGVSIRKEGDFLIVKGPKGEIKRKIIYPAVEISADSIILTTRKDNKKEKRMLNTFKSHVNNMIFGVDKGFTYKLKVCYAHFPLKVLIKDKKIVIENFLGEKSSRTTKIYDGVDVKVDGSFITVTGSDLEGVGQTAANLEQVTRITGKDRRVFQDGIFITEKPKRSSEP